MGKLANKVAVVTGASKGIGAEIARALAAEGASVVVNYGTSQADADKVVHDITAAGGRAVAIRGNVAKSADVERLLAEAVREFGVIDVLVNNAGVYSFSAIELVFGGGVPPAVRHQCSRRSSGDSENCSSTSARTAAASSISVRWPAVSHRRRTRFMSRQKALWTG